MESLAEIKQQLANEDAKVRIDALLDAWSYGKAGIELVIEALQDKNRKVRQSARLLLLESDEEIAAQALWNHLSFKKMQCLHTIIDFEVDYYNRVHDPNYFGIADYNNTLVGHWNLGYSSSKMAIWSLESGNFQQTSDSLTAHDFELGKQGKIFATTFEDIILPAQNLETQAFINRESNRKIVMQGIEPMGFAICKTDKPLVAIAESKHLINFEPKRIVRQQGKLEIWDYEKYICLLQNKFEDLYLNPDIYKLNNSKINPKYFGTSPLIFSPDGCTLIARFTDKNQQCLIKIWDTKKLELIQTIENLPKLIITSVGVSPDKTLIACGIREERVSVWELQCDRIIYSVNEVSPCILSTDGRVLIYATNRNKIVVRDLIAQRNLCTLQGHNAPVAYLALSEDREFIASYSIDKQIKIWAIPNFS